ncbi:hypothetical protein [Bacillus cereus]|uniref:Uncharacterized protein n=1 Tax=Bacillus cereus HuA3-9 TaxID=1053205 RepID=R8CIA3_BACCE|nr:hypothetical protein [Bacillus cereus]EOO11327.1 hypothetical protein IGA_05590 [Bacillus cereus HuA3-9]
MEIYEYCPKCNHKEVKVVEDFPELTKLCTDGYGQPVRFTKCECGSDLKGFFQLAWYVPQNGEITEQLLGYLNQRIDLNYEELSKE